ncbi:nitrogenase [Methanospirillum stamsii]|uniref:Nitrogenase n=2 Tax=Methanospirillum stamsii TaxID=1277351 RepID=A0A2V2N6K1_9EURY|nr:nitrogenase [Methanospirillum stamsii]
MEKGRGGDHMKLDPDGFIGTLLAIEGILDARAVMNGPTGCRGNPAYFSDRHFPRENSLNRRSFEEPFFFGQSRIPCTYLDSDDYILGSAGKLREILPLIAEKGDSFLAIVNSPGASLIGDDLNRFLVEANLDSICMAFEGAAYSYPLATGFDMAMVSILRWLKLNKFPKVKNRVNLLGFSINQKFWKGNVAELKKLCELMGLYVVCVPGAGSGIAEIRESTTASCNIVVYPEYSTKTAEYLESEYDIPAVIPAGGAPVGFTQTEEWISAVADATGRDPNPALEYLKEQRVHAFHQISRYHHEAGYPKGATFSIRGDSSFVLPLTRWLFEYLSMLPVSVEFAEGQDPEMTGKLTEFLKTHEIPALGADPSIVQPDFYFGDSLTGKDLELSGKCRKTIELYNRTTSDIYFTEKAYLGGTGALWILEEIFQTVKDFSE